MQAVKNMTGALKQQVENAAATTEETEDATKAAAEENIDKNKVHNEVDNQEAEQKEIDREKLVKDRYEEKISRVAADREDVTKQEPIDAPTPADLDVGTENPKNLSTCANTDDEALAAPASSPSMWGLL